MMYWMANIVYGATNTKDLMEHNLQKMNIRNIDKL